MTGTRIVFLFFLLLGIPALAMADVDWQQLETKNFILYYPSKEMGAAETLAKRAEGIREQVNRAIGYDFKHQTRVYLAPDREAYQAVQPRAIIPEWSVGVAFENENLIVIYTPRGARKSGFHNYNMLQVFHHELCHVILGRALWGTKIPRWLDEGFAKYQAHEWSTSDTFHMTIVYLMGSLIPLEELMYRWPRDEGRARIAYLQSKTFVAYLDRRGYLPRIIAYMQQGKSADSAVTLASGRPLDVLEKQWKQYLRKAHTWLFLFFRREFIWTFMALLFLFVYWRVRRRSRLKLRKMELEEELERLGQDGPTYH